MTLGLVVTSYIATVIDGLQIAAESSHPPVCSHLGFASVRTVCFVLTMMLCQAMSATRATRAVARRAFTTSALRLGGGHGHAAAPAHGHGHAAAADHGHGHGHGESKSWFNGWFDEAYTDPSENRLFNAKVSTAAFLALCGRHPSDC